MRTDNIICDRSKEYRRNCIAKKIKQDFIVQPDRTALCEGADVSSNLTKISKAKLVHKNGGTQ